MTTSIVSVSATQSALQVNGINSLVFNSAGDVQVNSVNGGQLAGMRNRIINGDMRIWQRGTGFSGIGQAPIYTTDRFTAACNGGVVSVSQGGVPIGDYLAMSINGAAGVTNIQAQTKLESFNVYDLGGGQITVSGYVYQSTGATVSSALLKVFRANSVDNFSAVTQEGASYTLPSIPSATWTFFKATFSVSSTASNGISITLESGTPVVAGQSFATTLWQCEKGSVATPFENRPVGVELALCQRYFETATYILTGSMYTGNGDTRCNVPFKVTKRITPILTYGTGVGSVLAVGNTGTATNVSLGTVTSNGQDTNGFYGLVSPNFAAFQSAGSIVSFGSNSGVYTASAEL